MYPILIWRNMYCMKNSAKKIGLLIGLWMLMTMPMMAEDVVYLTTEQFKARIFDYKTEKDWKFKGDKPCVIDFYTTWCGPCKRLAPIMEEMSQKYCDLVVFYKVDTEQERELAYAFGINSIPQVLYIPVEGRPMLLKGLYPKDEIERIIDEFLLAPPQAPKVEEKETPKEEPKPKVEEKKPLWQRLRDKLRYRSNKK